jgi:pilus assembly protein Flp/PilA
MLYLYFRIRNWLECDEGQDLAEYALLIGLIAVAAVAAVEVLGGGINATFEEIGAIVTGWGVPGE